jgi:Lysozyme like domain
MKQDSWILLAAGVGLIALGGGAAMSMGNLSASDIATYAANAGFSGSDLITAVSVALAESSGNPRALGDVGIGQGSIGLWQINSYYHPEFGPDFTILYDPQTNANAAYSIYSVSGHTFKPWSAFNSGRYQAFVPQVQSVLGA